MITENASLGPVEAKDPEHHGKVLMYSRAFRVDGYEIESRTRSTELRIPFAMAEAWILPTHWHAQGIARMLKPRKEKDAVRNMDRSSLSSEYEYASR